MSVIEKAEAFAAKMHEGQVGKDGKPYIEHPRTVASMVNGETEKAVAWLHDVVEDTDATIDRVRELFGNEIADAVAVMTHDKNVPYMDYVRNIKENAVARKVKMADLSHNMDLSRLANVTDEDLRRVEKYKKAYEILKG